MNEHLDRAFSSAHIGSLELPNRIIKAATFEGMTPDGVPGDAFLNFHKRIAIGGVAMTTIAYLASEADGRISDEMMYMHEGLGPRLSFVLDELRRAGVRVSGQLVHCGNFSRNKNLQRLKRPLGPSRAINLAGITEGIPFAGAMNEADIDRLVETYKDASAVMKDVGFDAIELHFGHGYALSQFISPKTNRRKDKYGGSLENRMRLPLRVLEAVRSSVGPDLPILGKMGLTDGVKGGLSEDEAIEVAVMLDGAGIDALVTSGGTSSFNVMKMFHGESFLDGLIALEENPVARFGMKMVGGRLFRDYPYEELYFLEAAKKVCARVNCQMVYVGGCSTPQSLARLMSEGFDFVQLGRALIRDPDFVNSARSNPDYVNGCTHCNKCVALIDHEDGVRCALDD